MSTFIPPDDAKKSAVVPAAQSSPEAMVVVITHEPFLDWFNLEFNGQTEELDHMECLQWFEAHGARNMDKVNDAINQAFNFHRAEVVISNPKTPGVNDGSRYAPKI